MLTGLYAKLIAAGIIVAAVLGAWWYVSNLRSTVETLKMEIVVQKTQNQVLANTITEQNASIATAKAAADVLLAKSAVELANAKKATEAALLRARTIYKKTPSVPGNTCEADRQSTLDLLNGVAK